MTSVGRPLLNFLDVGSVLLGAIKPSTLSNYVMQRRTVQTNVG